MKGATEQDVRASYARDASGLALLPDSVLRPRDERDLVDALRTAAGARTSVTVAGAQTSTTGASITDRGALMSLRALDQVVRVDPERRTVRASCGVIIADLRRACADSGLLFTPDPTNDESSTVGGAVACNASGARSFAYGATRPHVVALRVALADGRVEEFRRNTFEIEMTAPKVEPGSSAAEVAVAANYLMGQHLSDARVRYYVNAQAAGFYPDDYREFLFGDHQGYDAGYWE